MSILIADSGATKTEWCLIHKAESQTIFTEGLNPYYHTSESIQDVIERNLMPELSVVPDEIFFYGAGCDGQEKNDIVHNALKNCYPDASIQVYHDLLGAARACFLNDAGIACILGYSALLMAIAFTRELMGQGSLFGYTVLGDWWRPWTIMVMPPGAFFALAVIIWIARSFAGPDEDQATT